MHCPKSARVVFGLIELTMAGIYIHVPFCIKRCIYCDFFSSTDSAYKEAYISALLRELEAKRIYLQEPVDTIYFGGGTPSCLQSPDFEKIGATIDRYYTVSAHPEITIEANPDDLSDAYVGSLRSLPVNRISVGIQSFQDRALRFLNRRHTAREAIDAVERCKNAGIHNISIDLMYGLPEQDVASWSSDIEQAVALDVSHISAYNLTYESGTPIYKMVEAGVVQPADDDVCELLFRLLTEKLTDAGFVHYEISNFARRTKTYPDGCISLHNTSYWKGVHYLGVGPAAHSYDGKSRSWNVSSVPDYIRMMQEDPAAFGETEELDARTRYNDYIITRMRTIWGISLTELKQVFGEERAHYFSAQAERFFCLGLLKKEGDCVKVSPDGFFVSDAIMRELVAL